jgi:phosphate transport system permease protein
MRVFGNRRWRSIREVLTGVGMRGLTLGCVGLVCVMAVGLWLKSRPILQAYPLWRILSSGVWRPLRGEFGFLPFITGTLWVTGVAVALAVPVSLLTAIYLCEYAHRRLRAAVVPLIDVLAGIPSVIYGVWGVLMIVPLVKHHVAPRFGVQTSGYTALAGGMVLAVMILPVIINVCVAVLRAVPQELREASLSLGATKWQTVKHVTLRRALPGVIAANVLGLSRAFGETMAVLMVAGNVAKVPRSVLAPAYPLPALIANNYGEMMSIPLYDAALMLGALLLFGVVAAFNVAARAVLARVEKRIQ